MGYGMNAGIADGMNLAWLLAAVLEGWGDPAMPEVDVLNLTREAIACGIPLKVLDIPQLAVTDEAIYRHALVIVRQDQHVVWRGNKLPESVPDQLSQLNGKSAVANPSEEKIAEVSSLSLML